MFICSLFVYAVSSVKLYREWCIMSWKGYGRKIFWPSLRYYPGDFLDRKIFFQNRSLPGRCLVRTSGMWSVTFWIDARFISVQPVLRLAHINYEFMLPVWDGCPTSYQVGNKAAGRIGSLKLGVAIRDIMFSISIHHILWRTLLMEIRTIFHCVRYRATITHRHNFYGQKEKAASNPTRKNMEIADFKEKFHLTATFSLFLSLPSALSLCISLYYPPISHRVESRANPLTLPFPKPPPTSIFFFFGSRLSLFTKLKANRGKHYKISDWGWFVFILCVQNNT